jgi:hypothetical protein
MYLDVSTNVSRWFRAEEKDAETEDQVKMVLDLAEYLEARLASGRISHETYNQLRGECFSLVCL